MRRITPFGDFGSQLGNQVRPSASMLFQDALSSYTVPVSKVLVYKLMLDGSLPDRSFSWPQGELPFLADLEVPLAIG